MLRHIKAICATGLLLAVLLAGCASAPREAPATGSALPLRLDRVQSLEQDGVTVQVAIPTDEASSEVFGVRLAEHDLQPIWLRIENASDVDYWLFPIAIDEDYYSADEAALVTGAKLEKDERAALTEVGGDGGGGRLGREHGCEVECTVVQRGLCGGGEAVVERDEGVEEAGAGHGVCGLGGGLGRRGRGGEEGCERDVCGGGG